MHVWSLCTLHCLAAPFNGWTFAAHLTRLNSCCGYEEAAADEDTISIWGEGTSATNQAHLHFPKAWREKRNFSHVSLWACVIVERWQTAWKRFHETVMQNIAICQFFSPFHLIAKTHHCLLRQTNLLSISENVFIGKVFRTYPFILRFSDKYDTLILCAWYGLLKLERWYKYSTVQFPT